MAKSAAASKPLNIRGYKGNDTLRGGNLGDTLHGMQGNDILIGSGGGDTLMGGAGADTFLYTALSDSDPLTGIDRIKDFSAAQGDVVDLSALGTAILQPGWDDDLYGNLQAVFSYDAVSDVTTLSYGYASYAVVFQIRLAGNVGYSESFKGISPTVNGTEGSDRLYGGDNDTVYGFGGNDYIEGSIGMRASAGAGDDTFFLTRGGTGGALDGGAGVDGLYYFMTAVSGDVLDALKGTSTSVGGQVNFAFSGIEKFYGNFSSFVGTDASEHAATEDWITHTVTVNAGGGDDSIFTGAGDDTITGGAGNDRIDGQLGKDTAVFSGSSDEYVIGELDMFGQATVQHVGGTGNDGTDTLTQVEYLQFSDGVYDLTINALLRDASASAADFLI